MKHTKTKKASRTLRKKSGFSLISLFRRKQIRSIVLLLVIILVGVLYVLIQRTNTKHNSTALKDVRTNNTSQSGSVKNSSGSSASTASTNTSSNQKAKSTTTQSSTTNNSSSGSAQTNSSPPAPTPFSATASALKINEEIHACVNERYIFSASFQANKAGSATWNWIRWDGGTSGVSGTVTFDSNGVASNGANPYMLSIAPNYNLSGWVALKLTWDGGSYTSNHADFTYDASQVFPPGC